MQNNNNYVKNRVEEIFHLSALLLSFCKDNIDAAETACLYTGLNILHKKADDLNVKLMNLE